MFLLLILQAKVIDVDTDGEATVVIVEVYVNTFRIETSDQDYTFIRLIKTELDRHYEYEYFGSHTKTCATEEMNERDSVFKLKCLNLKLKCLIF